MFTSFLQGFLFSLSLCFDLGIVNVAIMKTGIEKGFKPSFMIGFGSCFGDLMYLSLALIGFTFIFEIVIVKWTLWILGTLVLLYLTYKMLREAISPKMIDANGRSAENNRPSWREFLFGIGAALSSPSGIIWFAVVAGPIVGSLHIHHSGMMLFSFMLGFFFAGLLWSFVIAFISSQTGGLIASKYIRGISLASALLFLYFAIKVFLEGAKTILNV